MPRFRSGDYIERWANNIEDTLDMSSKQIKNLTQSDFKNLLKNVYFAKKRYRKEYRREPTELQMDVLDLHYGRPVRITQKPIGADKKFFYRNHKTNKRVFINYVRKNKIGRLIDARTGRFVKQKK
ncbi:MAG: hypothetical protein ACFFDN_02645 [Candidatus Hodarchaeota archaeon]